MANTTTAEEPPSTIPVVLPRRRGPAKRRARRRPLRGSTKVHCYGNALGLGRNIAEALLDVSETGVRLLLRKVVDVGRDVEVNLSGRAGAEARRVARVVWVVAAEGGLFCVGCEFLSPIPSPAFMELVRA